MSGASADGRDGAASPGARAPRWRRPVVAALAVVALAAVAGAVMAVLRFGGAEHGDLRVDNPHGFSGGGAVPNIRLGRPYMYLLMSLCTAGGPVTVTGVTPHDPIGK